MKESDLEAFYSHLSEVRPIIEKFCALNGFELVDQKSLGRYPRIRIKRPGMVRCWFDLSMELDTNGRRYEKFSRDIPYELSAGAYVDVQDGSKYGSRFQKSVSCFSGTPFGRVPAILQNEMQKYLPRIDGWDMDSLKDKGQKIELGS